MVTKRHVIKPRSERGSQSLLVTDPPKWGPLESAQSESSAVGLLTGCFPNPGNQGAQEPLLVALIWTS